MTLSYKSLMSKFIYSVKSTLLIFTFFLSTSVCANIVSGRSVEGLNFSIATTTKASEADDGLFGDLVIKYKSGKGFSEKTFVYKAQSPANLTIDRFGLVIIGEKIGGMEGSYVVTYLFPGSDTLSYVGGVEISMTNGRYVHPSSKMRTWGENLGENERKRLVSTIVNRSSELIGDAGNLPIDDVLLFFAMPEVMEKILRNNPDFARQYSRLVADKIDSSLGNLIRRYFVGNKTSLCEEEQYDIFSCRVDSNFASVCLADTVHGEQLEYRYGKSGALSLKLIENRNKLKEREDEVSFSNGDYQYTVSNRSSSLEGSILVRRNGVLVTKKKCWSRDLEPLLFPIR